MAQRKYQSGDVVGTYTIIEYTSNDKVLCRCNQCGFEGEIYTSNLSRSKMCRKCRTKYNTKPKIDLTGQRFGRLTVKHSVIQNNGHTAWLCICNCGNTVTVPTSHLRSGHTRSCGCYMRDRTSEANSNDLTGMKFGKLLALHRTDGHKTPAGQVLSEYLCRCDCGSEVSVLSMNLLSGNTQSCGCIGCSTGEYKVGDYLLSHGVNFTKQYSFDDLRSSNGGLLRFDFALWNSDGSLNCLVEFNGEQHYYPSSRNTEFGKQQREETDKLKIEYCKLNNIKLYAIRYDEDVNEAMRYVIEQIK